MGSFISLEVLVGLADKYECIKCSALFYSKALFDEHNVKHHDTFSAGSESKVGQPIDSERMSDEEKKSDSEDSDTNMDVDEEIKDIECKYYNTF